MSDESHFDMEQWSTVFCRARLKAHSVSVAEEGGEIGWDRVPWYILFVCARIQSGIEEPFLRILLEGSSESDDSFDELESGGRFVPEIQVRLPSVSRFELNAKTKVGSLCYLPFVARLDDEGGSDASQEERVCRLKFRTTHDLDNVALWLRAYNRDAIARAREQAAASEGSPHKRGMSGLSDVRASSDVSSKVVSANSVGSVALFSQSHFHSKSGQAFATGGTVYRRWTCSEVLEWLKCVYLPATHPVEKKMKPKMDPTGRRLPYVQQCFNSAVTLDDVLGDSLDVLESFLNEGKGLHHVLEEYGTYLKESDRSLRTESPLHPVFSQKPIMDRLLAAVNEMNEEFGGMFCYRRHAVMLKRLDKPKAKDKPRKMSGQYVQKIVYKSPDEVRHELMTKLRVLWDEREFARAIMISLLYNMYLQWIIEDLQAYEPPLAAAARRGPDVFARRLVTLEKRHGARVENLCFPLWRLAQIVKIKEQLKVANIALDDDGFVEEEDGEETKQSLSSLREEAERSLGIIEGNLRRLERRSRRAARNEARLRKVQELIVEEEKELRKAKRKLKKVTQLEGLVVRLRELESNDPEKMAKYEVELMRSEEREQAIDRMIDIKLQERVPEDGVVKIPLKLIVAKNLEAPGADGQKTAGEKFVGVAAKTLLPVAEMMFGAGAPFGLLHALFAFGNCRFEWNANALVRFKLLQEKDVYEEVLCVDLSTPMSMISRANFRERVTKIAKEMVDFNVEYGYATLFGQLKKAVNCQQFAAHMIERCFSVERIPPMVGQFIKEASAMAVDETAADMVKHCMRFRPQGDYAARFADVPELVHGKEVLVFETHETLDAYVAKLLEVLPDAPDEFAEEWQFLKALDRAFWIRAYKLNGEDASSGHASCPFNVVDHNEARYLLGFVEGAEDDLPAAQADSGIVELVCRTQPYAWGKVGEASLVSSFVDSVNPEQPYAELWVGTHPNGPTMVKGAGNLETFLSEKSLPAIPWLFKILSIRDPLSIQLHPTKEIAAHLHASDPEHYKDSNHKPECAIALSEFEAMCGFKPHAEIQSFLTSNEELRSLLAVSEIASSEVLNIAFATLLSADQARVDAALLKTHRLCMTVDDPTREEALFEKLYAKYPHDRCCYCAFLLNYFALKRGESLFIRPCHPHSYISGDIVECMANSDNVIRAGLTPKFIDKQTLLEIAHFDDIPPSSHRLFPIRARGVSIYRLVEFPEFVVAHFVLPEVSDSSRFLHPKPAALIVLSGRAQIDGASIQEDRVYFLPPAEGPSTLDCRDGPFEAFLAMAQ